MNWLNKLERRFGNLAIRHLMHYIVGLTAFVYIIMQLDGVAQIYFKLSLIPSLVMRGEVWRLITYIFIPPNLSIFWIIFTLYFYYMIGSALEREWGSFRFNLYYFIGMAATTASAFISGGMTTAVYLNLSLYLAYARLFPNHQLLLFFVFPVKIKYLAWVQWIFLAFTVITAKTFSLKVAAIVSVVNYFIFFGKDIVTRTKTNRQVYQNRRSFQANLPRDITIHKCNVCGKTEKDDPTLDFRYCTLCDGGLEYCMEHLETQEHVKDSQK